MEEKISLKGDGMIMEQNGEQDNDKTEELATQDGAVNYDAGANPLEELVDEQEGDLAERDVSEEMQEPQEPQIPQELQDPQEPVASPAIEEPRVIDISKATIEELLPVSESPGFDNSAAQDARLESPVEGGVTNPLHSTGPMKFNGDSASEGGLVKPGKSPALTSEFELSGFHAEVKTSTGMTSVQITQTFKDVEMAKASINGDKYLMAANFGFIPCPITRGAPIICNGERQLFEYIDNQWRRV